MTKNYLPVQAYSGSFLINIDHIVTVNVHSREVGMPNGVTLKLDEDTFQKLMKAISNCIID